MITRQDKYNGVFENDLNKSSDLVKKISNFYKSFYDENKYIIDDSFDENYVIKYEDFNNEELQEIKEVYQERFPNYSDEQLDNYLKTRGVRPFDIAIIERETGKIIEGIEAKDFGQMYKYDATGVPSYYFRKMNLVKNHLQRKQEQSFEFNYYFQDNEKVKEMKKDIKFDFFIMDNFVPYGNKVEDLKVNETLSNNPYYASRLIKDTPLTQTMFDLNSTKMINESFDEKFKEYLKEYIKVDNQEIFFTHDNFNFVNLNKIKGQEFICGNKDGIEIYERNNYSNKFKDNIYFEKEEFKLLYILDKKVLEHEYIDTSEYTKDIDNINDIENFLQDLNIENISSIPNLKDRMNQIKQSLIDLSPDNKEFYKNKVLNAVTEFNKELSTKKEHECNYEFER